MGRSAVTVEDIKPQPPKAEGGQAKKEPRATEQRGSDKPR